MKNKVSEGNILNIPAPKDLKGGEPFMLGDIPLVATSDAKAGDLTAADRKGVFLLAVAGKTASGNKKINVGDKLYFDDSGEVPVLNLNNTKKLFGKGLSVVSAGTTGRIEVLID